MANVAGINTDAQYQRAATVPGEKKAEVDGMLKGTKELSGVLGAVDGEYLHIFDQKTNLGVVV